MLAQLDAIDKYIPDPEAEIPPYTNVSEWKPPEIVNPEFERLYAEYEEMQRNPNYRGRWEPPVDRSLVNNGENAGMLAEPVVALGISIDIVTAGIIFDNIFLDIVEN